MIKDLRYFKSVISLLVIINNNNNNNNVFLTNFGSDSFLNKNMGQYLCLSSIIQKSGLKQYLK